jgi:hypothetical protein
MSATDAKPWHDAALELAKATWPLVNRTDRFGGYYVKNGVVKKVEPTNFQTDEKIPLTKTRFLEHFKARFPEEVIGLHGLTVEPSIGNFAVIDIDYHDSETDDAEGNERFAIHIYTTMHEHGVKVIPLTWDNAGFHVWVLFSQPVPGERLYTFGEWLAGQAEWIKKPEWFPKQKSVPAGKSGNWIRLFGMHPKDRSWPKVFDGETWVSGERAVNVMLEVLA